MKRRKLESISKSYIAVIVPIAEYGIDGYLGIILNQVTFEVMHKVRGLYAPLLEQQLIGRMRELDRKPAFEIEIQE